MSARDSSWNRHPAAALRQWRRRLLPAVRDGPRHRERERQLTSPCHAVARKLHFPLPPCSGCDNQLCCGHHSALLLRI
jgi:hypothetical protein